MLRNYTIGILELLTKQKFYILFLTNIIKIEI